MTAGTAQKKRKILFDLVDPDSVLLMEEDSEGFERRIDTLRREQVASIIIVASSVTNAYSYLRLVKKYENGGFPVRSVYLPDFDYDRAEYVTGIIHDMIAYFGQGSVMVVSYGKSYVPGLLAAYLVYTGRTTKQAIRGVGALAGGLSFSEEEKRFLECLERELTGAVQEDEPESAPIEPKRPATPEELSAERTDRPLKGVVAQPDLESALPAPRVDESREREPAEKPEAAPPMPEAHEAPGEAVVETAEEAPPGTEVVVSAPEKPEPPAPSVPGTAEVERPKKREPEAVAAEIPAIERRGLQGLVTSLRFKLISIISLVIALSLSGMIFLATYFFEKDNRIRVQESNHEMAGLLSIKARSDFVSIMERTGQIAGKMLKGRGNTGIAEGEREIVFVGIAGRAGGKLVFNRIAVNEALAADLQIPGADIGNQMASAGEFLRAIEGDTVIENLSSVFRVPTAGIAYPLRVQGSQAIESAVIAAVRLDGVLKAFQGEEGMSRGFDVMMVNDRGTVIAHADSAVVLANRSFMNLPIVAAMVKSAMNNGQTRYTDEKGVTHLGSFRKIGVGGCAVIATVEEQKALQAVYDIQRRNIYLMVIVLTIVVLIVFFFGQSITTPIIRLVGATKRIKEGQYRVNIKPVSRDEIGELTASFIEMGKGLEEREKMKDAFGKFVNKEIAEQVLKGELKLGGERKNAVVFFSDIRSFTAISERLEPEEVVEFLNEYMTRMVQCVNATFGVVDKFIGDAIMAIWGTPLSHGNDTENAVNAALMMRRELIEYNKDRGGERKPIIRIGCGINSGPVLAGQIGSNDRMEYTVIGDTVNLASRVEALNKPFGTDILVTEESFDAVREIFRVEPMQKIKVKGKEEPQQIFAVLGRIDDPESPKTLDELRILLGIETRGPVTELISEKEEVKYEIIE